MLTRGREGDPGRLVTIGRSSDADDAQASGVPRPGTRSDAELLLAAQSDPAAFGEFYLRHAHSMVEYFAYRCSDSQDTYDLAAETFAEVLQHLDRYNPNRGDARAFLHGIAKNKYRRYRRQGSVDLRARTRLGMRTDTLGADDLAHIDQIIDLTDHGSRVGDAIDQLPTVLADAVRLRVVHELSYEQVADTLGISLTSARKRVSRGLHQLAASLGSNPFETHD